MTNKSSHKNIFLSAGDDLNSYLLNERAKIVNYWGGDGSILQKRWEACQNFYYGQQTKGFDTNPGMKNVGLRGEFKVLVINEYRAALKHIFSIVTQDKLTFDCQSYNTDQKSKMSSIIGNTVLEYFFSAFPFSSILKSAFELALGCHGTAFVECKWDHNQGELRVDENGNLMFMGQPTMNLLSVYDVFCCALSHDWSKKNWVLTREVVNRYELAAEYPDHEDEILSQPCITENQSDMRMIYGVGTQDEIYVWNFYHKKTRVLPNGRYRRFLTSGETVYESVDEQGAVVNPYGQLPVFIIRPEVRYGHVWGYTPGFDLLPVQEATNNLDSTIMTNFTAFGIQNIVNFTGNGITPQNLGGGLKVLNVEPQPGLPNGGAPYSLQLCAIPNDAFRYRDLLSQKNNSIVGSNDAARGQQSGEASGTSVALSISQAQQSNGSSQENYVKFVEEVATFLLLGVVRTFQKTEQMIDISGKSDQHAVLIFKGEDLSGISRVKVTVGNPLGQTIAGRMAVAKDLVSTQTIDAQQYMQVIKTGDIKSELDTATIQMTFIRQLGEALLVKNSKDIPILATDNHQLIIKHLKSLTQRMDVRIGDEEILSRIEQKIIEATNQLEQLNANNQLVLQIALDLPLQLPSPIPGVNSQAGGAPADGEENAPQGEAGDGSMPPDEDVESSKLQEAHTRADNLQNKAQSFVQNAA